MIFTHKTYPQRTGKAGTLCMLYTHFAEYIPAFMVATNTLTDEDYEHLLEVFDEGQRIIIRSSASVEDGANYSFAGIFESKVCTVNLKEINTTIEFLLDQLQSEKIKAYTNDTDFSLHFLIQEYVEFDQGMVVFSTHPINPSSGIMVNAISGGIEGIVQGDKSESITIPYHGVISTDSSKVTTHQLHTIKETVRNINLATGYNFDMECGFVGGMLRIVQVRPITTTSTNEEVLLDSSNIRENFPEQITPLTFSVLQQMYWETYSELIHRSGAPYKQVYAHQDIFKGLLAHRGGWVYYNMSNWYKMAELLPRSTQNQTELQAMITGKVASRSKKLSPLVPVWKYIPLLLYKLATLKSKQQRYTGSIKDLLAGYSSIDFTTFSLTEIHAVWTELSSVIDLETHVNAENDFLLMYFLGAVQKRVSAEDLTTILAAISSSDPVTSRQINMLERIEKNPENTDLQIEFLRMYSGRFEVDLDLARVDTSKRLLRDFKGGSTKVRSESTTTQMPNLGMVNKYLVSKLAHHISVREENRLLRSQIFALMRSLFNAAGHYLSVAGVINEPHDVHYLTVAEIFDFITLQSYHTSFQSIVQERKDSIKEASEPNPYGTSTIDSFYQGAIHTAANNTKTNDFLGCSPGTATGETIVLGDQESQTDLIGKILVASRLDPGSVVNFSGIKGLIIEHGGILSHGAIIAREMGIPAIINVPGARSNYPTGTRATINGLTGEISNNE